MDYLKRYQPEDSEAYTMVALKFSMYRDIAAMLEACGCRSLKCFKDKPLGLVTLLCSLFWLGRILSVSFLL